MSDDLRGSDASGGTGEDVGVWFDRESDVAVDDAGPVDAAPADAPPGGTAAVPPSADGAPSTAAETAPGIAGRVSRRVVRRPLAWWNRPWTPQRVVQVLITTSVLRSSYSVAVEPSLGSLS